MAISASHTAFLDEGGNVCFFRGINDPQIIPQRFNGAGYVGGWTNQLIPGVDSPYTCDTHLICQDDHEYFFKVMWLLRQFKRGDVEGEKLLVRVGTADKWGNGLMFGCWRDNRARFYQVIDAAVEACAQTGAYLLLTLFGFADGVANSEWHGLFDKSDPNHAKYVAYIRDVRAHLSGKKGVLGLDIANEPDHEKHVAYWGDTKVARMTKYLAWEGTILDEIDLGAADQCLVTIGHALGGTMFDYQWDTGWFITEPNKHPKLGFASQHPYWYGAPASDYQYKADRIKYFWGVIDKPGLVGEWGDFRSPPPAGHGYSDYEQWIDDILASRRLSNCAMRMWPRPNWPVKSVETPAVPAWSSSVPVEAPIEVPVVEPPTTMPEEAQEPATEAPVTEPPSADPPVVEEPPVEVPEPTPELSEGTEPGLTPEQASEQTAIATPTPTPVPDPVPTPSPSSSAGASPDGKKKVGIDFGPIIDFLVRLFKGLFKKK